ncbi:MAG TPA: 3-hydroxybutyrate dehydrogenase [Stellaceae bacterium]|nr:3-hydroxybutyrate dehydrogenase [Stellaceae bacterium]
MIKGKAAVVTGSTSGIGLAIASRLAAEGCAILLNGFGERERIETLKRDLSLRYGVKVAYHGADMREPPAIREMINEAVRALGAVDILVNNAGIQHVAPIESFPEESWDKIIAVNLSSAFHTIKAALPAMKKRRWGRIINIASAHGLVASAQKAAYVAAKHGIVGLTKTVAIEAAGEGVTCNAICPGWVLTPLVEEQLKARAAARGQTLEEAKIALLQEKQPLEEFTSPAAIGDLVVFLCGEAARTMTGAALSIDGGWVAQ